MTKQGFIEALEKELCGIRHPDTEERLNFYSEMIDNLMEEGLSEEDAVKKIGTAEDIAAQILADDTLPKIKTKPARRLGAREITLIIVGSPLWIPLVAAGLAVGIALLATLWSVDVSLWAVFGSLVGAFLGGIAAFVAELTRDNIWGGLAMLGMGLFSGGLSIFCLWSCMAATKGAARLTKKSVLATVSLFRRKENGQ